jgi:hypothetical protein
MPGMVMERIKKLTANETEAANRAEATALLIRAGYRVYRPEADCYGEDLILRTPSGELRAVQLKSRPTVDRKYGNKSLWILFPAPKSTDPERKWFLVHHDRFYKWAERKHGHTRTWEEKEAWHYPTISNELKRFLDKYAVIAS